MKALESRTLLGIWESLWNRAPCEQAVGLLFAALPEFSEQEILGLPIGRRDALLLNLRILQFGSHAELLVSCPACLEQSEVSLEMADLLTEPPPLDSLTVSAHGGNHRFRLPNSADLLALMASHPVDPRRFLVEACVESRDAEQGSMTVDVIDAISAEMAEHDPQANLALSASCAHCHHDWDVRFDIVSFLWSEITTCARRLFSQIHALASTYGWSEEAILAMSETRRQIYLTMSVPD